MRNAERGVRNQVSRITPHGSRNPEGAFRAPHSALRASSAFTLLELLTVIAIMGILAAIALPAVRGLKPNAKVAATRQLLDAASRARQLAMSQRTTVYMVFLSTNFFTGLSGANLDRVRPLLDKQLTGYAYVTLRSVGDQPGVRTARYLSSWKTLPQGAYIPTAKFYKKSDNGEDPVTLTNTTLTVPGVPLFVPTFPVTNNIPFPSEEDPVTVPVWLPYIAFDSMGSLVSGNSQNGQPELIPLAEGSVNIMRDAGSKAALPLPAVASERPPDNTIENHSLVCIDPLTGRGRVERRKVQ